MSNYTSATQRNAGLISPADQQTLQAACVAIAGVGGVGGRIATQLTRLGVGRLKLADPDIFTDSNLNRQEGAYVSTLGKNKAEVIAALCRDINPEVVIEVLPDGITASNVHEFVAQTQLVVDATDFQLPQLGVMLARASRSAKTPLLMGIEIAYGAAITWFSPNGYTYERYLGLPKDITEAALEAGCTKVDLMKFIPHLPIYSDAATLKRLQKGEIDAPVIAPAVDICAGLAVTQAVKIICQHPGIKPAPYVMHFDAWQFKAWRIRLRGLHQLMSIARYAAASLGRHTNH